ncbi:MAG: hypothetical protein WD767_01015 [Alphaproteobacteria bacterium]
MNESSARKTVIGLLEGLGNDDDAEVLATARTLHAKISEMGVTWDELLVQDDGSVSPPVNYAGAGATAPEDYDDNDSGRDGEGEFDGDGDDVAPRADDAAFDLVGAAADDIRRIEQIQSMKDISESLREELDGFLEDIKENEFTVADRHYLEALQQRLSKGDRRPK